MIHVYPPRDCKSVHSGKLSQYEFHVHFPLTKLMWVYSVKYEDSVITWHVKIYHVQEKKEIWKFETEIR